MLARLRRPLSRAIPMRMLSTTSAAQKTIGELGGDLRRLKLADEGEFVIPIDTPISQAAQHLQSNRLTFALVADDSRSELLGMITERDILRYTTHAGALAFFGKQKSEATIERWMTPRNTMLSVALSDTMEHAASLLRQGIWRHVPVLDYWGRLHSILVRLAGGGRRSPVVHSFGTPAPQRPTTSPQRPSAPAQQRPDCRACRRELSVHARVCSRVLARA